MTAQSTGLQATVGDEATDGPLSGFSPGYRNYALLLLMCVYIVNFLDRQVINIVAEPIKQELGLADWQIGVMSGLAFAVFYTLVGIPIARLAERRNRPLIIAACVTTWCTFTAVCGFAQTFIQLVLARIGVGVGEAGGTPPAHSLISDYFPRAQRATALAVYSLGSPFGGLVGLLMGGLVADAFGWRAAFFVAGAPGLAFALLVALTLREPRRRLAAAQSAAALPSATFLETLRALSAKPTFWYICGGSAVSAFIAFGHITFLASFFLRNHPAELASLAAQFGLQPLGFMGLSLGLLSGLGGAVGAMLGGALADRFGAKDLRAYMIAPALGALVIIPLYAAAMLTPSVPVALLLLGACSLLGALYFGPVWATVQGIAPAHMRATASAIQLLSNNLIGLGFGPLLVGTMSDVFAVNLGLGPAEGLRWSMVASSAFGIVTFALFWAARRSIRADFVG